MTIKLRTVIKHPSRVEGSAGIEVTTANGVVSVALDLASFAPVVSIADQSRTTALLVTPGLAATDADVIERIAIEDLLALAIALDPELAAIAGLTSAADKLPYFTGSGTAALADLTAFGRSLIDDANAAAALTTLGVSAFAQTVLDDANAAAALTTLGISAFAQTILDDANAAAARATLGLVIGTDVQAQDAELAAIAGLTSAADKLPYFTGAGTAALADFTSFGRSLVDDANAAAARTTLGLVIGTNVQAQDAELSALAGLTSAADKLPYFTGSGTASLADFTSYGRSLVDDANASAARTTLGLAIGTDVQAFHARLADVAGISYAQGDVFYYNGSNLVKLAAGPSGQFLKTNGAGANPSWDVASGTATAATQAEMEAASSTSVFVTPGRQHYHPSAAKAWAYVTESSGSYSLYSGSYNITSITKNATGEVLVTIATDFSSANWCSIFSAESGGRLCNTQSATKLAGSVTTDIRVASSATAADATFSFVGYGDQ